MESLNPIDQIQVPVIVAMMGLVVLTFFLLRRVFFAPYVAVMEQRETQLEAAETTIAEAERIVAETEPEAQVIVAAAREKASDVLRKARDDVEDYRRQVIDAAMQEAAHELEGGRAKIAAERETEVASLREQAIECVTMACDKLLGSVEPAAVAASVDKFLARRAY
jgi:F-type H+-transporting ATPase subunit b